MAWQILVQLKGSSTPIYSTEFDSRDEAEADLAKIRASVGVAEAPDVPWMAAYGRDILGAHAVESRAYGVA